MILKVFLRQSKSVWPGAKARSLPLVYRPGAESDRNCRFVCPFWSGGSLQPGQPGESGRGGSAGTCWSHCQEGTVFWPVEMVRLVQMFEDKKLELLTVFCWTHIWDITSFVYPFLNFYLQLLAYLRHFLSGLPWRWANIFGCWPLRSVALWWTLVVEVVTTSSLSRHVLLHA